mmetsp:Transcript_26760/g.42020  ORF Transcript_26760/g.42020 Transcript_26760/m.42020 type:complete len:158 (+) Transcript_26760:169-642(+)
MKQHRAFHHGLVEEARSLNLTFMETNREGDKGLVVPRELVQARKYFLASNSMEGLQTYTKMLVGAHLFLRQGETMDMKTEDIDWDLCIIDPDGTIVALCFVVEGKSDDGPQYFLLWRRDECVEFCPVRHLLAYLDLWGITSGYLWPDSKQESPRSRL